MNRPTLVTLLAVFALLLPVCAFISIPGVVFSSLGFLGAFSGLVALPSRTGRVTLVTLARGRGVSFAQEVTEAQTEARRQAREARHEYALHVARDDSKMVGWREVLAMRDAGKAARRVHG